MSRSAARRLGALLFVAGALNVVVAALGCSSAFDGTKVEGEPCTRTEECVTGLMCIGGVCRGSDAGPPRDSGTDADVRDGDVLDGDVLDGDVLDGDVPDGDVPDGDVRDAEAEDAELPDGASPDAPSSE